MTIYFLRDILDIHTINQNALEVHLIQIQEEISKILNESRPLMAAIWKVPPRQILLVTPTWDAETALNRSVSSLIQHFSLMSADALTIERVCL